MLVFWFIAGVGTAAVYALVHTFVASCSAWVSRVNRSHDTLVALNRTVTEHESYIRARHAEALQEVINGQRKKK